MSLNILQKQKQKTSKCYCNSIGSTCSKANINCLKNKATGSSGSLFNFDASKKNKQKERYNKSSTEKCKQKTDFVKLNRRAVSSANVGKNRRGLGHSDALPSAIAGAGAQFSRRNSAATTVTFSTPCVTPAVAEEITRSISMRTTPASSITTLTRSLSPHLPSLSRQSSSLTSRPTTLKLAPPVTMTTLGENFRALSVSAQSGGSGGLFSDFSRGAVQPEYTDRRRTYENVKDLMKLISADNGNDFSSLNVASAAGSGDPIYGTDETIDGERLRRLQQFRMQNADDCFSVHRQLDLRLPMQCQSVNKEETQVHQQQMRKLLANLLEREEELRDGKSTNPRLKVLQQKKKTVERSTTNATKVEKKNTSLTPYAIRQRLLQLRMEAEEIGRMKPGRNLYGNAMGNSFALRYKETY